MFTGIVEETGKIRQVVSGREWGEITVEASKVLEGTKVGDSIAVNGVCLTVTKLGASSFCADVMAQTLRSSGLGTLIKGDSVNLERAMAADGRFGGHIVSGHIDGCGTIRSIKQEGNSVWIMIAAPEEILELIVDKGSVAIDGVSLTVAETGKGYFKVSVIPHTGENTSLLKKKAGDCVNLENDVIGKYVKKLMGIPQEAPSVQKEGLTLDFLHANGF